MQRRMLALPCLASALVLYPVRHSRPVHTRCGVQAAAPQFTPLESPAAYEALISEAGNDSISVIKYVAPWCRTCRAAGPKLDAAARRWPGARFYSLDLVRNGKAAGERRKQLDELLIKLLDLPAGGRREVVVGDGDAQLVRIGVSDDLARLGDELVLLVVPGFFLRGQ